MLSTWQTICTTLDTRLQSLVESNKQTLQLVHRLSKLGPDLRAELRPDLVDRLKRNHEQLDLVGQDVDDLPGPIREGAHARETPVSREKARLEALIARLAEDLKSTRSQFRRAQLQALRNDELARKREREHRFSITPDASHPASAASSTTLARPRRGPERAAHDDARVTAQSEVTDALQRTLELLQSEVDRSRAAQEVFEQSSRDLRGLAASYTDLDALLSSSSTLLRSLLRTSKTDSWYLQTTFYLLLATVGWLLFRRLLWSPIYWLLLQPVFLLFRLAHSFLATVGVVGGSPDGALVSSATLIVQPSATEGLPHFPRDLDDPDDRPYMPVGAGGQGAKQPEDPSAPGSLSQRVGQMAERSRREAQEAPKEGRRPGDEDGTQKGDGPVRRGDGTVLGDSEAPRNPKKRMMEVPPEERTSQGGESVQKRDEL